MFKFRKMCNVIEDKRECFISSPNFQCNTSQREREEVVKHDFNALPLL